METRVPEVPLPLIDDTVAFFMAVPATSQMMISSAPTGVAFSVSPSIVKSVGAALPDVTLPFIVQAAMAARRALASVPAQTNVRF